jgi:hypothetical protein
MTSFFAQRVGNSLHPSGDESIAAFSEIPFGKMVEVEVRSRRNIRFLNLYWAMCARIATSTGANSLTAETVSDLFKICTGHCTLIRSKSQGEIKIPKSISFAKLDDIAFGVFFKKCVVVAFEEWKIPPEALNDLLEEKPDRAQPSKPD